MAVQEVRPFDTTARRESPIEVKAPAAMLPRPAAVDAITWGATLLTQLGFEPDAIKRHRRAA